MFELLKACSSNFPYKKCVWKYLYDPSHSLVSNILFMFVHEKQEIAGKCKQPGPAHVTMSSERLDQKTPACASSDINEESWRFLFSQLFAD